MNNKVKTIIYILVFVVFVTAAGFAYSYLTQRYKAENPLDKVSETETGTPNKPVETQSDDKQDETGDDELLKAIDFKVYDYDGNEVTLFDYIGTPIVLNFWASWCGPCKSEMPHFNKVSEEYSKDELIFLMVDLVDGQRETVETGKKYVEENGYTFTVLFDTEQDAAIKYGIRSIPSTLFIDKDGYVQAGVEGSLEEAYLRRGIELILDEN